MPKRKYQVRWYTTVNGSLGYETEENRLDWAATSMMILGLEWRWSTKKSGNVMMCFNNKI